MTAARSFITARRRSKALLTPPAASCTASLLHTVRASRRRGKRGRKLVWVIVNPGHNPARVTHRFLERGFPIGTNWRCYSRHWLITWVLSFSSPRRAEGAGTGDVLRRRR